MEETLKFTIQELSSLVRGLQTRRSHLVDFGHKEFDHELITGQLADLLKLIKAGDESLRISDELSGMLVYWGGYIHASNVSVNMSCANQWTGNFSDYPDLDGYMGSYHRNRNEFKVDESNFKRTLLRRLLELGLIKLSASQIDRLIDTYMAEREYMEKSWRERDRGGDNFDQNQAIKSVRNNHSAVLRILFPSLSLDQMEKAWPVFHDQIKILIIKKSLDSDRPPEMLEFLRRKLSDLSERLGTGKDSREQRLELYGLGQRINDHISKRRVKSPAEDKQALPKRRKEMIF